MADCFYVTLGRDIWRNCNLCLRECVKFQTWGAKMFLRKFYQISWGKMLPISGKFSHFQYATLEMFKAALNNYSMLKLRFLINTHNFPLYRNNVYHQCYTTNHDTKPQLLSQNYPKIGSNYPKIGIDQCLIFFFIYCSFFYYAAFFPLKGKLTLNVPIPVKARKLS